MNNEVGGSFMADTFILVTQSKNYPLKQTETMKTNSPNQLYMKKHITVFIFMMLLILMLFGKASAQEVVAAEKASYFKIGFGYGFPSGSQMVGSNSTYTYSASSSSAREKGIYGSLGSGLIFNTSYILMY